MSSLIDLYRVAIRACAFTSILTCAGHAAIVAPLTPEIPGVTNSFFLGPFTNLALDPSLSGTLLADATVAFSSLTNPYNGGHAGAPVTMTFRNNTETIPFYLAFRYALNGATFGPSPNANPPNEFSGTLRSVVARNTAGTLDFYYQLTNTSTNLNEADIFRLTLGGFEPFSAAPLDISYRTDGLAGIAGLTSFTVGSRFPGSADRDPAIAPGGIGFDFPIAFTRFLGDPRNVYPGQQSNWLVVRTDATTFGVNQAAISASGTAVADIFAPAGAAGAIPELSSVLTWGLLAGLFGLFTGWTRGWKRGKNGSSALLGQDNGF
jgi:hypothetical protein